MTKDSVWLEKGGDRRLPSGVGGKQKKRAEQRQQKSSKGQTTRLEVTDAKGAKHPAEKGREFEKPNGGPSSL